MAAGDRCLIASVHLLTHALRKCVRMGLSISSVAAELVDAGMSYGCSYKSSRTAVTGAIAIFVESSHADVKARGKLMTTKITN